MAQITQLALTAPQEEVLELVLRRVLGNMSGTTSGKHIMDSVRIELADDQHKALMEVLARL